MWGLRGRYFLTKTCLISQVVSSKGSFCLVHSPECSKGRTLKHPSSLAHGHRERPGGLLKNHFVLLDPRETLNQWTKKTAKGSVDSTSGGGCRTG